MKLLLLNMQKKVGNINSKKERSSTKKKFSPYKKSSSKKLSLSEALKIIIKLKKEVNQLNKEMQKLKEKLEAFKKREVDYYDFSPIGYFTLDEKGTILEVNLTGASMLGMDRKHLLNKPFITFVSKDDYKTFESHHTNVFKELCHLTCEIKLKRKDNTTFLAQLQSIALENSSGQLNQCRTAVIHLTDKI